MKLKTLWNSAVSVTGAILVIAATHRGGSIDFTDWPYWIGMLGMFLFAAGKGALRRGAA